MTYEAPKHVFVTHPGCHSILLGKTSTSAKVDNQRLSCQKDTRTSGHNDHSSHGLGHCQGLGHRGSPGFERGESRFDQQWEVGLGMLLVLSRVLLLVVVLC